MAQAAVPPQSQDAEVGVLGSMILSAPAFDAVAGEMTLRPDDFYRDRHRVVYAAIVALRDRSASEPVDVLTVCEELSRTGKLEAAGGREYVHSLPNLVPSLGNVVAYAKVVADKADLRRIAEAGQRIADAALSEDRDAVADAERLLAVPGSRDHRQITVEERQEELVAHVEKGEVVTWPWPFRELNDMTGGIWPGQFTVIAGVTRHGKSVLVDQVLEHLSKHGLRCAAYLNEMTALERDLRFVARRANLSLARLMLGKLRDGEHTRFARAVAELPFELIPAGNMTAHEIVRDVRRRGWQVVAVDLLNGLPGSSKTEDIDENIRTLVAGANELGCHIFGCQHLNRNRIADRAYPPEPTLGDIRGSGQIADLANNVVFIYRRERLDRDAGGNWVGTGKPGDDAYIDLAKVRNGVEGRMSVAFQGSRVRFVPTTDDAEPRGKAA